MKKIIAIFALIVFLLPAKGPGQGVQIPDNPMEEFLITTDRDLYMAGETIWFVSHCIVPPDEERIPLSKVIYTELFSSDKKVIARGKFYFDQGCSSGQLIIPAEQPTGVYYLRAYTQYLKNFHPATWPMKMITVVNPSVPLKIPKQEKEQVKVHIAGRQLIAGIPAECALQAPPFTELSPETVSLLADDTLVNQQIPIFSNGLAYFTFNPKSGKNYSVRMSMPSGDTLLLPLPEVQETGSCLLLDESMNTINCRVMNQGQSPLAREKTYYLTVSNNRYASIFYDSVSAGSPVRAFSIEKELLSPGMNYFLLTDQDNNPIDLRIFFQSPDQETGIRIEGARMIYGPREEVEIQLVAGAGSVDKIAQVSIAVVKKGTHNAVGQTLPRNLIDQPVLLSSWSIPKAVASDSLLMQLKALLVIDGGELLGRMDLLEELQDDRRMLTYLPEMRDITISGSVRNLHSGDAVPGSRIFLSYVGGTTQIHVNESQPDGSFIFPLMPYQSQQDLFLCTFDKHSDQEILINSDFSNDFPVVHELAPDLDTNDRKLLEQMYINQQVTQRYDVGSGTSMQYPAPRELGFGQPEISIRLADYIDLPNMEVVLNEIVPFVKVRKRKGDYRITILDSETGLSYENHLVMVDNIPLYDINELMQIHPANVEKVDVINRTYVIGDHTFQGILLVKTSTSNFGGITTPPDAVFITYPMITQEKTFIPVKEQPAHGNIFARPDLRNLLFWAPSVSVKGSRKIKFLTSDHFSEYDIIVTGITDNGEMIYARTSFRVEGNK